MLPACSRAALRPVLLSADLPGLLARLRIAGGAVSDALVALAALDNGAELATRDARARDTHESVGVRVVAVARPHSCSAPSRADAHLLVPMDRPSGIGRATRPISLERFGQGFARRASGTTEHEPAGGP